MNAEALNTTLEAWRHARTGEEVATVRVALERLTPAGLTLRPNHAGTALNVCRAGESDSLALLYLNPPRGRGRDPELVRLAALAIDALGEGVAIDDDGADKHAPECPALDGWKCRCGGDLDWTTEQGNMT